MSDYKVEIDGQYDLSQINKQISGEEAGASEFISNEISQNKLMNIAAFHELAPGTVPLKLILIKAGEAQPGGSILVWSGPMIVSGARIEIEAYRIKNKMTSIAPAAPAAAAPIPHGFGEAPRGLGGAPPRGFGKHQPRLHRSKRKKQ